MTKFNGTPFQYNPAVTNVNIDNQLAGVLSQFNDDYIIDVVKDSLNNRFRIYSLPGPNVVAAFEATFKQLTDGFASNTDEILDTRRRVYRNIINIICDFYNLRFNDTDETDYYSAAYCLYDFLVSNFTEYLKNFYSIFLSKESAPIVSALGLTQLRKDNDTTLSYSKKLFKDPNLAMIHCDLEYVITQIEAFNIDMWTILSCVYQSNPNMPTYINSLITDYTGGFFKNFYQTFVIRSKDSADVLTYIKLNLQQIGSQFETVAPAT